MAAGIEEQSIDRAAGRRMPQTLLDATRPGTGVSGHYGVGKTNFAVNLAMDLADAGYKTCVIDLDIVNPYFRASEQRAVLEDAGIDLVAPVFAEAGSSLDVPSLTGAIAPRLSDVGEGERVIVDLGGDDVGAVALGRFSHILAARDYAMLYVVNRHRNLVAEPADAIEVLREIEAATRLRATAIVDNAHMKQLTDAEALADAGGYASTICEQTGLPLVAKTLPEGLFVNTGEHGGALLGFGDPALAYPVKLYVRSPWE